jgi:hypothetical protein
VRQWRGGSEIGVSLERGAKCGSNGVKIMAIGAVLTELWLLEKKLKKYFFLKKWVFRLDYRACGSG